MRILVLDDDRTFVEMMRAALSEEGHEVVAGSDGRAGLKLARQLSPDVILLDILMPNMSGPAFAREYARQPGSHAPIVVVSAARPSVARGVRNAVAYVRKPFDLDLLLGLLSNISSP
jgi:DNA-binding response OmpR family regulator